MFINVKLNGHNIRALVDTGSEITMISDKLAKELGLIITKYRGKQVTGVNAQPVEITGQTQVNVVVFDADNERLIPITAVTIRNFHLNFLLGYDFHYASRSLIDIYNNNIVFNSLAVQNAAKPIKIKPLVPNNIKKMHSIENIEVPPNGMHIVKCAPSNKRTIPDTECFATSNPSLLSKRKIFVKDQNIKVKDGIANVPVINLSDNCVAISAGSIVGDYELPILCATATASGFDIMSNPKIAKVVEEDSVAYGTFCKILDLAKGIPEIVSSIASRLCIYCSSVDCQSGEQCLKRNLYFDGTKSYRDSVFESRMPIMILSAEYTLWSLLQKDNVKEGSAADNTEVCSNVNGILFNESDIKLSAECLFQELYVRAVDETFDPHNVIYFFNRMCEFCNRYNCSDPDFQCVHVPAINKSDNYKCYKQAERKVLDVLIREYIDRNNLSLDVVERYRKKKQVIAELT
jgi:hypothetical protein